MPGGWRAAPSSRVAVAKGPPGWCCPASPYLAVQLLAPGWGIPGFLLVRPASCCGSPAPAPRFPAPLSHSPKKAVPCSCFPQRSSPGRAALPTQAFCFQGEPVLMGFAVASQGSCCVYKQCWLILSFSE